MLRGCIHEPHSLASGVLRGFPHFSHGGPYLDKTWSHRTLGLVSRKPVIRSYSRNASANIFSSGYLPVLYGSATRRASTRHRRASAPQPYISNTKASSFGVHRCDGTNDIGTGNSNCLELVVHEQQGPDLRPSRTIGFGPSSRRTGVSICQHQGRARLPMSLSKPKLGWS